jgi:hypothetical protein
MWRSLVLGAAIACGATACRSHWTVETTQPAIVLRASKASRTSRPLTIVRREMELRYLWLANTAYYVVVSRDRLRFHVTLRHKWESMSDVRTWEAWVEDGRGVRHDLEEIDQHIEQVDPSRVIGGATMTRSGRLVGIPRAPVFYRGVVDFTVYGRDLFAAARRVTLVLRRPGYEYRYVWKSAIDPEDPEDPENPDGLEVAPES